MITYRLENPKVPKTQSYYSTPKWTKETLLKEAEEAKELGMVIGAKVIKDQYCSDEIHTIIDILDNPDKVTGMLTKPNYIVLQQGVAKYHHSELITVHMGNDGDEEYVPSDAE